MIDRLLAILALFSAFLSGFDAARGHWLFCAAWLFVMVCAAVGAMATAPEQDPSYGARAYNQGYHAGQAHERTAATDRLRNGLIAKEAARTAYFRERNS